MEKNHYNSKMGVGWQLVATVRKFCQKTNIKQ